MAGGSEVVGSTVLDSHLSVRAFHELAGLDPSSDSGLQSAGSVAVPALLDHSHFLRAPDHRPGASLMADLDKARKGRILNVHAYPDWK